jgi:hypothetical protein
MTPELSRRGLIGCIAAVGLSPAVAVRVEKFPTLCATGCVTEPATVTETPLDHLERSGRRSAVQDLVARYRDLMQRHQVAYDHFSALYRDVEPCPTPPTTEWWDRYRETPAYAAEDVAEDLLRQSDEVLTTLINNAPCQSAADVAAKLELILDDGPLFEAEREEQYALRRLLAELEDLS